MNSIFPFYRESFLERKMIDCYHRHVSGYRIDGACNCWHFPPSLLRLSRPLCNSSAAATLFATGDEMIDEIAEFFFRQRIQKWVYGGVEKREHSYPESVACYRLQFVWAQINRNEQVERQPTSQEAADNYQKRHCKVRIKFHGFPPFIRCMSCDRRHPTEHNHQESR